MNLLQCSIFFSQLKKDIFCEKIVHCNFSHVRNSMHNASKYTPDPDDVSVNIQIFSLLLNIILIISHANKLNVLFTVMSDKCT